MKHISPMKAVGILSLLILADKPLWADVLPGAAMPERVSRELRQQAPATQVTPVSAVEEKKEEPSPMMEEAKKIKFQLNGIELEGNRVFSDAELSQLYKDKLHKTITVADLFEIVQSITNYYRNNGYIISRAVLPPQHVKGGVVRVQIIEGYIGAVDVSGNPKGAECLVLGFGRQIQKCRPLEIKRMEKYLTLANEIPNTSVKAVLSPSKTLPGAADLTLVTENKLISGYVSYDNYGTLYIGPQQMTANLGFNSLINSGDAGQATFTKTPRGTELTYTDINYNGALDFEGDRYLLGWTRAHTHPLFTLQPQKIDGLNTNFYTGLIFPIWRERDQSLTTQLNFNYLDSNVQQFGNLELYTDHIRSLGAGASYNFADRWYGANLISSTVRQGLPIWGYTSNTDPETALTSRPGGRADYTKFDITLSRVQAVRGAVSAFGLFKGQWAFNPLLASEQFSFGGSQLGRGYDVAEIIGDKGLATSFELRYDMIVDRFYIQSYQFYGFWDFGAIWNFKKIADVPTKQTAMSMGFGNRFYFTKYISGNIMWAQPLTKQVSALTQESQVVINGIATNRGNGAAPRVFFSVVAQLE